MWDALESLQSKTAQPIFSWVRGEGYLYLVSSQFQLKRTPPAVETPAVEGQPPCYGFLGEHLRNTHTRETNPPMSALRNT